MYIIIPLGLEPKNAKDFDGQENSRKIKEFIFELFSFTSLFETWKENFETLGFSDHRFRFPDNN